MSVMAFVRQENAKLGGTKLPAPRLEDKDPLQPFEERQLKTLIQQVEATPPRIRQAFFAYFNAK